VYNILANVIVAVHFLFIAFVVFGGLLVIRWPRIAFVHIPAIIWGAAVELFSWFCPLTPLENYFRNLAGDASYSGDFIVRYLISVIYPENLTVNIQYILGAMVIIINIIFYTIAICKQHLADKKN
jgi:hypothetical protein